MKNVNEPREDFRDNDNTPAPDSATMPASPPENVSVFNRSPGVRNESSRQFEELRGRWNNIQTSFVDEPRQAVYDADKLVSSAITQITAALHDECSAMQKQWADGADVSTEELRLSLQKYRLFFNRLMSMPT